MKGTAGPCVFGKRSPIAVKQGLTAQDGEPLPSRRLPDFLGAFIMVSHRCGSIFGLSGAPNFGSSHAVLRDGLRPKFLAYICAIIKPQAHH